MAIPYEELRFVAETRPAPYWPTGHFIHGEQEEIVATLYWDHDPVEGLFVDRDGVLDESPVKEEEFLNGWTLHVLAEESPDPTDPRVAAPHVDVWGDLPVADALDAAWHHVMQRAVPSGLTHEESRERLMWRERPMTADPEGA